MLDLFIEGFMQIMNIECLFFVLVGVFVGTIMGAIPGLTGVMAVAVMLPFTYAMDSVPAIAMLMSVFSGATFGGAISAVLINTPGTPAAVVTSLDGYAMAKKGDSVKAIKMALLSSVTGGIIGWLFLVTLSPVIAKFALKFGPGEYVAIVLFALTVLASLSKGNVIKGLIGACFGMLVGCMGMDPMTGTSRFDFGSYLLTDGIALLPILIGMYAIVELLKHAENLEDHDAEKPLYEIDLHQKVTLKEYLSAFKCIIRGSVAGAFIGAVPGISGNVMSYVNYDMTKRESKDPDSFGKGNLLGVAAAECADNAGAAGALVPLLTLGIPGSGGSAILLGAFTIQGLIPGPTMLMKQGSLVYALFVALLLSNLYLLILGLKGIKYFAYVGKLPVGVLYPVILALCMVGAFATNYSMLDCVFMVVFTVIGYIFYKSKIMVSTFVISVLLADMFETNFRRMVMAYHGNVWQIFESPIAVVFLALAAASLVFAIFGSVKDAKKAKKSED